MKNCRPIVDQFLYRSCVDRRLRDLEIIDGDLFDELEDQVRTIEGMLSELSSSGVAEDDEAFIHLADELDDTLSKLKDTRSKLKAHGIYSPLTNQQGDDIWIQEKDAVVSPQIRRAQRDADRFLAEAGIEQGARVVAKPYPGSYYGVMFEVQDSHTGELFYGFTSPTMLKDSLTFLKLLLDKHEGRIEKSSLEPNALRRVINRTVRAVACPTCKAGVGADCVRPSGHTLMGGDVHPKRWEKYDKRLPSEDAKLGYTKRRGSSAMHGTPLSTEDYSETVSGPLGSVTFSPEGIGSVPVVRNNEYMGFMVWMKPSDFLALNPLRSNDPSFLESQIREGADLGISFLDVEPPDDWHTEPSGRGGRRLTFRVIGHEGRTRMRAVMSVVGDVLVPVAVHASYTRARNWTPVNLAGATLLPDERKAYGSDNHNKRPFTIDKFALQGKLYQ